MDSQLRVTEMTAGEMNMLRTIAIMSTVLSIIVASICVGAVSLSSQSATNEAGSSPMPPLWILISETTFGTIVLVISLLALGSPIYHSKDPPIDDDEEVQEVLIRQQRATTWPLLAAVFLSLPFRNVAELTRESNFPNLFLLYCADTINSFGIAMALFYVWMYPFSCAQSRTPPHDDNMEVERRKLPILHVCVCACYALLRIGTTFGLRIHLKPLPLQNLSAFLALVIQGAWSGMSIWNTIALLGLSLIEFLILVVTIRDSRVYARLLMTTVDNASHQIVIALRYFQQSALLFFFNCMVIDVVSAFASRSPARYVIENGDTLILSQPLGQSAISTAITAFAMRDFYVHQSRKESGFVSKMYGIIGFILSSHSPARKNDLVYRVSDERNPRTEFPVPQKNTFSLETATLLFNMAWLATMYSRGKEDRRVPADFGRPAFSLYSEVKQRDGKISAIILEGMDRIIVAFKPVSVQDLKHNYLLPLSKTFLGKALEGKDDDFNVRSLSPKNARLFQKSKVHAGFETVYSSVQGQILQEVSTLLLQNQRPIYVTGYGSGGAVANLCILDLGFRRLIEQSHQFSVYTFGAMKAMNSAMARLFESHVPYRWRCVVSGDSVSVQPLTSSFKHPSKVATFTRTGHLTIEYIRTSKWWQSKISVHPMHKLSAYYCALESWHSAFHIKRPIDLWTWPVDRTIERLFKQEALNRESRWPINSALDSPTPDIESRSVRKLDSCPVSSTDSDADDVVAFSR